MKINTKEELTFQIQILSGLRSKYKKLGEMIAELQESIVRYLEIKNLKGVEVDGNYYAKQQNTSSSYDEDGLRVLLQRHNVYDRVFTKKVIEVRNDEEIGVLMREGVIEIDEILAITKTTYTKPFIRTTKAKNNDETE